MPRKATSTSEAVPKPKRAAPSKPTAARRTAGKPRKTVLAEPTAASEPTTAAAQAPESGQKRGPAMSAGHKAALAIGREQGRAVRRYLEALDARRPKRGRRRTAEGIARRLAAIEERLPTADPLTRLHLVQERIDLQRELDAGSDEIDLSVVEAEFTAVAAAYGARKGITYDAWRQLGVAARVLGGAGIRRGQ